MPAAGTNRLTAPALAKKLRVVVGPCNFRRSPLFKEIAILAVPRHGAHALPNPLLMLSAVPGRRFGASKGGHYIGTYGRPPMSPIRHPAKARARRSLIVVSIRLV
jgi:hypothetical protein